MTKDQAAIVDAIDVVIDAAKRLVDNTPKYSDEHAAILELSDAVTVLRETKTDWVNSDDLCRLRDTVGTSEVPR